MKLKYAGFILAGVVFFVIVFGYFFRLISEAVEERENNRSVVVNNPQNKEQAKKYKQSVQYNTPYLFAPFPFYVIEVSPEIIDTTEKIVYKNDVPDYIRQSGEGQGGGGGSYRKTYKNFVNLIFLDENHQHIHTLLDKKGLILEVWYPSKIADMPTRQEINTQNKNTDSLKSKTKNVMARDFPYNLYAIVFEDTNKDGRLNENDVNDLYISDVNGKNLKKIHPNIDIRSFKLWNGEKKFFIKYLDCKEDPRYRMEKYAFYDIQSYTFTPLETMHNALKKVEKIIAE